MVKHGDELFTEERLLMSDQALNTYLHQLIALQETQDSEHMMKAVEEVVLRFNEMNEAMVTLLRRWNVKNWLIL